MADAIRTDTIDLAIQQSWFAKLCRNVKLSRRQWFWVIVIGIPLALSTYVGIRWHSISEMQEATNNHVTFFGDSDDLEWSGMTFYVYKKTIGPLIFEKIGLEQEALIRVRIRALFERPITEVRIYPPGSLSPEVGALLRDYDSLNSVSLFNVQIDATDLVKLATLPRLKSLYLNGCRINGNTVECLSKFSNLEYLTFSGDLGLEEEMFEIKQRLGNCKFTVNGVEIPNLTEFLNLNPPPETEAPF